MEPVLPPAPYPFTERHNRSNIRAVRDTLAVVNGKWKLAIVCALFAGKQRFTELQKEVGGITPRMLARELRELELNGVLRRYAGAPASIAVAYELTPSGMALRQVISSLVAWGLQHREATFAPAP